MEEESSSPHSRKEAERDKVQKGLGTKYILQRHTISDPFFLHLGSTS
jgi:hypothetical protein